MSTTLDIRLHFTLGNHLVYQCFNNSKNFSAYLFLVIRKHELLTSIAAVLILIRLALLDLLYIMIGIANDIYVIAVVQVAHNLMSESNCRKIEALV